MSDLIHCRGWLYRLWAVDFEEILPDGEGAGAKTASWLCNLILRGFRL